MVTNNRERTSRLPESAGSDQVQPLILRDLAALNHELNRLFPEANRTLLNRAMRYALFPGGKRLRPLLCLACYRASGGHGLRRVLPFACAIECIHTFSLIQDDLPAMDNDRERRGKPALHVAFDEATAVLTSDALFSRAFEILADARVPGSVLRAGIRCLTRAIGPEGIVQGQLDDLCPNPDPHPVALRRLHARKTARFISASMTLGAIVAQAPGRVSLGLARAGTLLGMLFQITDDLLDSGQDRRYANRMTYPGFYGIKAARFRAERYQARYAHEISRLAPDLTRSGQATLLELGQTVLARKK